MTDSTFWLNVQSAKITNNLGSIIRTLNEFTREQGVTKMGFHHHEYEALLNYVKRADWSIWKRMVNEPIEYGGYLVVRKGVPQPVVLLSGTERGVTMFVDGTLCSIHSHPYDIELTIETLAPSRADWENSRMHGWQIVACQYGIFLHYFGGWLVDEKITLRSIWDRDYLISTTDLGNFLTGYERARKFCSQMSNVRIEFIPWTEMDKSVEPS